MQASNYATEGKEIGVQDTTMPVNRQAIQATADVLAVGKDYANTSTVRGFEQQERNQYEDYIDFSKEAGLMEDGIRLQGEAQNRTLTAEENARVAEFESMAKMDADAYAQGLSKRNRYQLNAQRRLRSAIMQRPDLADEFRRISAREIGTDVSSFALQYYWENLDDLGKALEKKQLTKSDVEFQIEQVEAYVKSLPAEQQAEYASTTKRKIAMLGGNYEAIAAELGVWSQMANGSPVMNTVNEVRGIRTQINDDSETLSREIVALSDSSARASLFADPSKANDARLRFMSLRQRFEDNASRMSSFSSSDVLDEPAKAAMQAAKDNMARIDAAFPDLSTESLQKGSQVYIAAELGRLGPQIIGRARVAGLANGKVSDAVVQAGMLTFSLGEKVMNNQTITKVEALQSPLQNYNMLVTGLSTNVADNATDAKKNYGQYAIAYVSATLPYVVNLASGPDKPATEVRALSDYTDSLDGVMAVNNRNSSFLDGLWNSAAEQGDTRTQDMISYARYQTLNGYSRSIYMDVIQRNPEMAQYIRAKDFVKSASKDIHARTLVAWVGEPPEAIRKELNAMLSSHMSDRAYTDFFDKTTEYYKARGQAISKRGGNGFTRGGE
jgi:hypothetical protein